MPKDGPKSWCPRCRRDTRFRITRAGALIPWFILPTAFLPVSAFVLLLGYLAFRRGDQRETEAGLLMGSAGLVIGIVSAAIKRLRCAECGYKYN
jgi:hypothetical protein